MKGLSTICSSASSPRVNQLSDWSPIVNPAIMEGDGPDHELLQEMALIFLQQEPVQRGALAKAISEQDRTLLSTAAHSLRGSLTIFVTRRGSEISEQLESNARAIDMKVAYALFVQLQIELDKLRNQIQNQLQSMVGIS
jgi:HPt (histidine-containing phosphotransfer) domain-containing protein